MEFNYDVTSILRCNQEGFAILDGTQPYKYRKSGAINLSKHAS